MAVNQRFEQIESLLTGIFRSSDRHSEILISHTEILLNHGKKLDLHSDILQDLGKIMGNQTTLLEKLNDHIERVDEERKLDAANFQITLNSIDNQMKYIIPLVEKALDQDERIRRLEAAVFNKGA